MPPPPAETRATRAGKWLLAVVIPASGLALGSIPIEMLMIMSALAAVSCGLLWFERDERASRPSQLVLLALALLVALTIFQAVPLPAALARTLTPANADIWDRALSGFREPGPAWHTISIAPGATRVEVLRGCFYACVFLSALRVARLEHGEDFLLRLVVFSTVVMAIATLAHLAVGADKVFGVYRPREVYAYRAGRLAPLLNTNHLAAYLDVGACVALGALVTGRRMPRALSASAVLVLAATSVWQGSRGATGALLLGVVLTIALTLFTRRRFESGRANAVVLAACAAAAAFMISMALSDVAREHLVSNDLTKVDIAKKSLGLVASSPWLGFGRGGFETVFSSVREGTLYFTFTHPEDIFMQWLVEWGVPATVAGMALLGWAMRPQVVLRAVRPAVGAWVALITAILHDVVDFHFEVPGFVALAAVCMAVVVSGRPTSREPSRAKLPSYARLGAMISIAGVVLSTVWAWSDIDHSLAEERRNLSAMAVDKNVSSARFAEALRAAIMRYPSEPFLALMGAVRAQSVDGGNPVPWVARALERNPRFGRGHFVLARSLASRQLDAQARLEYRLAFQYDQHLREQVVKEGVRLVEDADSALELVPAEPSGVELLDALVAAIAMRLPSSAVILDKELELRSPSSTGPLRRRVEAALADTRDEAAWCKQKACIRDGLAMAEMVAAREPNQCASHLLIARLRVLNGESFRAVDELEKSIENVVDRADCQRELITLALGSGQVRRGEAALDKLVRAGCGATAECVDLYAWAGAMEEGRGHFPRAVRLYRRVVEIAPEREDLLQHIGELGEQNGVLADAIEAYGILATRHPEDPRWQARLAELRGRVAPRPGQPLP